MDSLTAQALRIVLLQNESEAINEVKRLKKELALWKGKVEIPNKRDCWRVFINPHDVEFHTGWTVEGTPIMHFIDVVDTYVFYSGEMDGMGGHAVEELNDDGPYYIFRMPWNVDTDVHLQMFNQKKGDPVLVHLQTHELHLLENPICEHSEVVMNLDGKHAGRPLWFYRCKSCCEDDKKRKHNTADV